MNTLNLRTLAVSSAVALCSIAFVGCTTTKPQDQASSASSRASVDAQVDASLSKLYDSVKGSRELVARSSGVLVFPAVVGASMGVGAEYGRGALRVNGRTQSYYSTTSGSLGFQAGAQSKAVVYVFTTQAALDKFRNSKGWTAGADATVAAATVGANGSIDTNTLRQPVVGFVMTNVGLEAGVSLSGAKITEIQL
ncbi:MULTISPECIES: BPSL1445 family SYLF domain-containing lipoprotein [Variovorax]|uniref:BPSL1445 family SYLF domain-containing lipoprotein n=1 Tax=Variovorax TaxID=34072 RepID=UPI00086ABDAF|nr:MULTISPECIES: YSC84-related protein [Variovorax]MBN8757632.1 twin-arginine translocation pathway signal [Variovorax sp.]ODU13229.1 MAG: twin-arginine translocation pathway signal [Variovorax sp. SCN 67-85]ODV22073.1 MAG: twin-arginine translocation pathway signal [Variovorax sp. SCN 67-20]OJZ07740.1 MAG: twin-arginine translocation pathway signal [Variovorax sp. 67-131]UKI10587.1 twin-arginine translocation pathway signal [Variovorax paradoxus]